MLLQSHVGWLRSYRQPDIEGTPAVSPLLNISSVIFGPSCLRIESAKVAHWLRQDSACTLDLTTTERHN